MIATQRLGALTLTGLALVSLACSPKEDRTTADTAATTTGVGSEVVTTDDPAPVVTTAPVVIAAPVVTPAPTTTEAPIVVPSTIAPVAALMPDVMCMNLQDAQDLIQEQGVFLSYSQDATGGDRSQIIDANWQVVNQFPATGTPIGEGVAMLDAVKYGESSPCP